jgi:hypothetical protein
MSTTLQLAITQLEIFGLALRISEQPSDALMEAKHKLGVLVWYVSEKRGTPSGVVFDRSVSRAVATPDGVEESVLSREFWAEMSEELVASNPAFFKEAILYVMGDCPDDAAWFEKWGEGVK